MKKTIAIISVFLAATLLGGCSGDQKTQSIPHISNPNKPAVSSSGGTSSTPASSGTPTVYLTKNISSQSLMDIYAALNASPSGKIAVKLSTGESGSNYLRTDLIGDLVRSFDDPTIVECNTAYGGARSNTARHYQIAKDHGHGNSIY